MGLVERGGIRGRPGSAEARRRGHNRPAQVLAQRHCHRGRGRAAAARKVWRTRCHPGVWTGTNPSDNGEVQGL